MNESKNLFLIIKAFAI